MNETRKWNEGTPKRKKGKSDSSDRYPGDSGTDVSKRGCVQEKEQGGEGEMSNRTHWKSVSTNFLPTSWRSWPTWVSLHSIILVVTDNTSSSSWKSIFFSFIIFSTKKSLNRIETPLIPGLKGCHEHVLYVITQLSEPRHIELPSESFSTKKGTKSKRIHQLLFLLQQNKQRWRSGKEMSRLLWSTVKPIKFDTERTSCTT